MRMCASCFGRRTVDWGGRERLGRSCEEELCDHNIHHPFSHIQERPGICVCWFRLMKER